MWAKQKRALKLCIVEQAHVGGLCYSLSSSESNNASVATVHLELLSLSWDASGADIIVKFEREAFLLYHTVCLEPEFLWITVMNYY